MKTIREYIEEMLLYKESIGYCRHTYEYELGRFCNFIESKMLDATSLTEDFVLNWCTRRDSETQTGARKRFQVIREFLKYLSAIGVDCYVIPSHFIPRQETRTPYIFTDNELTHIFRECDTLKSSHNSPHRHLILPVLLRLIYFCGLRPNEGRELKSEEINFDKGVLHIRKNKTGKERYVAMSPDVLQMCKEYQNAAMSIFADRTYFFPSPSGAPFGRRWLSGQFRKIWQNIRKIGNESNAVVYDLRHRYATAVMMKWLDEGADIYAKLPYLSAYMGHSKFSDTAYYIHLLPEKLIRSTAIDWSRFSDIIPEVSDDE